MNIQKSVSLKDHSTMRLGGTAAYLATVQDRFEIPSLVASATKQGVPVIMIGDGSNIIWGDGGYPGLVIVNQIKGFEVQEVDGETAYVTIGGGENWDSVVERAVELGYNGIAELSLIPGTAGATPVQNVGAYGREIKDTLVTLEAYDITTGGFVSLTASDCEFGYRTSRFKTTDKGRFLITGITLLLRREKPSPPFYDALATYLKEHAITAPSVQDVRNAVIEIRSAKLPDPKVVANNGSFFANPIVDQSQLTELLAIDPAVKYWHQENGSAKVSAAWLVEQAGFKDFTDKETGMATWPKQPLVVVNEFADSTAKLLAFKQKIVDGVAAKFGITLEQEPELIG